MPNPARTSEVSPAPTHTGMDLNASGVITSPAWLAWFQRIAFPAMKLTLEMRDAAVFEPVVGRDIEPDIEDSVEQRQSSEAGRYVELIEEERLLARLSDPFPPSQGEAVDEIVRQIAAADNPRPWQAELDDLRLELALVDTSRGSGENTAVIEDTHAHRANYDATAYPDSFYWETDRTVLYLSVVTAGVGAWTYVAGSMSAALASIPNDLGAGDVNFRFGSTDYLHEHRWDGGSWHFSPGDPGSGWCVATASGTPQGGLWAACDGSSPLCALDNGTSGTVATPNTSVSGGDSPFIMGGAGGIQHAATITAWDPTAKTGNDSTATQSVQSGAGATVPGEPHTHPLSAANAKLLAPNEVNGGLPLRVSMAWYMRR